MKYQLVLIALSVLVFSCKQEAKRIDPSLYLNKEEQFNFKYSVSRYVDRLPKNATEETKFDPEFDEDYKKRSENAELMCYYVDKETGEIYFAIAKIAPSLVLKKVVTAGKLKKNEKGDIIAYEEEFRTWKMEVAELKTVSEMLFNKYVNKEDLSPFYTRNAQGKFIIEFPDEHVSYDKEKRTWISNRIDPLEDYYNLKKVKPNSNIP
jgi:hypothetical protein